MPNHYLYDNTQTSALDRLHGLESIEDAASIARLEQLTDLQGCQCLEIGAGAGSIALWLAGKVGPSGSVVATDIEPIHLEQDLYTVWAHDIELDELPAGAFDLVHLRHLLIHLQDPAAVLDKIYASLKPAGLMVVEESDLNTWVADEQTPAELKDRFRAGVKAIFSVYRKRQMAIELGSSLPGLMAESGFSDISETRCCRTVEGGSAEAAYQSLSARQLASSVEQNDQLNPHVSLDQQTQSTTMIRALADCLLDSRLSYQSRTTVSVSGRRTRNLDY